MTSCVHESFLNKQFAGQSLLKTYKACPKCHKWLMGDNLKGMRRTISSVCWFVYYKSCRGTTPPLFRYILASHQKDPSDRPSAHPLVRRFVGTSVTSARNAFLGTSRPRRCRTSRKTISKVVGDAHLLFFFKICQSIHLSLIMLRYVKCEIQSTCHCYFVT